MGGPFRHGFTNTTRRVAPGRVLKRYEGPGSTDRCQRELHCLSAVGPWVPVPLVLEHHLDPPSVVMTEMGGRHGQELIEEGHADLVMARVGELLRGVQAVPSPVLAGLGGEGPVLVHRDFGPHNVLIDPDRNGSVVALVDWEFAHQGTEFEDLAWAEWTLRMHHPAHVAAIPPLLEHSGLDAPWPERHRAMLHRCSDLAAMAEARRSRDDVALWRGRLEVTEGWLEI